MKNAKLAYLEQVKIALKNHPNATEIYQEISCHIEEGIKDKMLTGKSEELATEEMLHKMGDPGELGKSFHQPHPSHQIKCLVLVNWLFFVAGIMVTTVCNHSEMAITQHIWNVLVFLSHPLLFIYSIYWLYLGYSIGKLYGPNGKKIINKTLIKASIPNLVLMTLVLFQCIPAEIFSPSLDPVFILLCVSATFVFYPISKIAFKIGILYGL